MDVAVLHHEDGLAELEGGSHVGVADPTLVELIDVTNNDSDKAECTNTISKSLHQHDSFSIRPFKVQMDGGFMYLR